MGSRSNEKAKYNNWKEIRLVDCVEDKVISYGIVQPGKSYKGGIPVLRVNNFRNGEFDLSSMLRVHPDVERKYEKTRLKGGEVLLTLVGSTGQSAIVPKEFAGWNVPRAIAVIRPTEEIGSEWINIILQTKEVKHFLDSRANTTVQKTLNLKDVKEIPVKIPPNGVKKKIVNILGSLDDKIAVLRKMNETLEQMARALFQSWFVEDKREYLREMHLGNLVDIDTGFAFKSKFYQDEGELKVIRGKNVTLGTIRWGSDAKYWSESTEGLGRYFLNRLDIVIGMDGSRVGRNRSLVLKSDLPSILAQRVARVRAKNPALQPLIWRLINSKAFEQYVELIKTGTSIPHISQSQIASFEIRVPSFEEMERFSHSASSFIDTQEANLEQIQTLTSLRDTLLPKLISGELVVDEKLTG